MNTETVPRQQVLTLVQQSGLSDPAARQHINGTVVDEVIETRYKRQWWEVAGCAPLNVSGTEYLRPVANVAFGADGWVLRFRAEWFCN